VVSKIACLELRRSVDSCLDIRALRLHDFASEKIVILTVDCAHGRQVLSPRDDAEGLSHCRRRIFQSLTDSSLQQKSCHRVASVVPLFTLDLNGSAVVVGGPGKDHQVSTWVVGLATHQLADWSDRINDGCPRRVGHEALQWF
jgi:hypothetical protein